MKEIVSTSSEHRVDSTDSPKDFKGYTIEELRYQRALIALKKDFCQSKLLRSIDTVKRANPLSSNNRIAPLKGKVGGITSKLFSSLNYIDYAMMGFSLFNSVKKVYGFFHKRK